MKVCPNLICIREGIVRAGRFREVFAVFAVLKMKNFEMRYCFFGFPNVNFLPMRKSVRDFVWVRDFWEL